MHPSLSGTGTYSTNKKSFMGRSQETAGKKEVRNKKDKKRKEKEKKRALKKSEGKKSSFDDMIAYVDEFGVISSTPPDPGRKKQEVVAEDIEIQVVRTSAEESPDYQRKGIVTFYNNSKGFGFIRDLESDQRLFFHASDVQEPVKEDNIVSFEKGKGPRGISAINVRLFREQTTLP